MKIFKKIVTTLVGIFLIYGAVALALKASIGVLPVDAAIASISDVLGISTGMIAILFHGLFFHRTDHHREEGLPQNRAFAACQYNLRRLCARLCKPHSFKGSCYHFICLKIDNKCVCIFTRCIWLPPCSGNTFCAHLDGGLYTAYR